MERDSRLADFEDGLRFQERLLFGERMERVNVQLMVPGVEIDEGKGRQPIVDPVVEGDEKSAVFGVVYVVPVSRGEKLWRHPFNLSGKDVLQSVVERLGVVALAAETEGRRQSAFGQKLVILADQFRENLLSGLHDDDMPQSYDPDLSRVAVLAESLHTMDVEQLRMNRSLVKAEKELFYALFSLSSLHGFL